MSGLTDILQDVAPTIARALGGPLVGAAVSFLSSKLGVPAEQVEQAVAGMSPADLVKMKELDYQFQQNMAEIGIKLDLAQIAVNQAEAANTNWFVAGWRPAVGWVGALGLAYVSLAEPIARFVALVGFKYAGAFPVIDTSLTIQVLIGILGLGAARTVEKVKGAEGNR